MKWVAGFHTNSSRGIPAINALVVLNDPSTGLPRAVLDGGPITAMRTAAVSGVAIGRFGPAADAASSGRPIADRADDHRRRRPRAQPPPGHRARPAGRGRDDRRPPSGTRRGARRGGTATAGIGDISVTSDARAAARGADVVITAAAFTDPAHRQVMDGTGSHPMRWSCRSTTPRSAPRRSLATRPCSSSTIGASSSPIARPASSTTFRTRRPRSARRSSADPRPADGAVVATPPRGRARRRRLRRCDRAPRRGGRHRHASAELTGAGRPDRDRRAAGRRPGRARRRRRRGRLDHVACVPRDDRHDPDRGPPRDRYGPPRRQRIAQIAASTTHDLFLAQGFVHAQERMWQMKVWRHISSGRLAELFGSGSIDTDRFIRTLGWRTAAERDLAAQLSDTRAALEAYADGVNAWLDAPPRPARPGVRR